VKRLARVAYSDLPETQQQNYTLDDFTQSLNNIGLHNQLQARGVTTIEATFQDGEAYLQAERVYQVTQGDDHSIPHQAHRLYTKSFQTDHPMLEVWRTWTPPLGLLTNSGITKLPQTAEIFKTPRVKKGEILGWVPQGVQTDSAVHPSRVADTPSHQSTTSATGIVHAASNQPLQPASRNGADWRRPSGHRKGGPLPFR